MNAKRTCASNQRAGASPRRIFCCLITAVFCGLPRPALAAASDTWQAGVATIAITPDEPMWMAGYAARTKPADGKVHDLHAKALVLEDGQAHRLALVTVDLLGIDRAMRDWIVEQIEQRYQIPPANVLINASHTHSGPVIRESAYSIYGNSFYDMTPEQLERSNAYSDRLQQHLVDLVGAALTRLAPARLAYTHARAGFAMNRRRPTERGVINSPYADGPVDHEIPVLRVESPEGQLRAILFGYACHATTLSGDQYCGDYPGFAQEYIEQLHPGTTALFLAGCGGDQNPYPRNKDRALELCQQHGRALANGVETALQCPSRLVRGPLRTALEDVTLDFATPPSRAMLEQQVKSDNKYERMHAEYLLQQLEHEGAIRSTYTYPIQVIRFGDDLTMVALAGEVVVDYALRLKRELTDTPLWVAGYSNDVFGYVPSVRVLREGGYEGGGAMLYTPWPGPFAPSVEERVVRTVHKLADAVRAPLGK